MANKKGGPACCGFFSEAIQSQRGVVKPQQGTKLNSKLLIRSQSEQYVSTYTESGRGKKVDLHFSGENRNVRCPSFQEFEVICGNLEKS